MAFWSFGCLISIFCATAQSSESLYLRAADSVLSVIVFVGGAVNLLFNSKATSKVGSSCG